MVTGEPDMRELNGPTIGEVYRLQLALRDDLKTLNEKWEDRAERLDTRISSIEVRSAFISGAISALGAVIQFVFPFKKP